jgi:hypothetical protein
METTDMKSIRIAVAAALLMTSGGALAQSAKDAQCLILSNAFAQDTKDTNAQKLAEASMYFYLGRIAEGETATQLKTLLDAQAKTIDEKTAGGLMNTCINGFKAKMDLVQSLAPKQPATPPKK